MRVKGIKVGSEEGEEDVDSEGPSGGEAGVGGREERVEQGYEERYEIS